MESNNLYDAEEERDGQEYYITFFTYLLFISTNIYWLQ